MLHCSLECWNLESLNEHWMVYWKLNGLLNIEYTLNTAYALNVQNERKCIIIPKTNCLIPRSVETLKPLLNVEWFVEHWMCIEPWMACWLMNMPWTLNCSLDIKWFIEYSHKYTLNMGNQRKCPIVPSIVEILKHPLNIDWFIEHWMVLWILNMHWTLNDSLNIEVCMTRIFLSAHLKSV